MQPQLQQPLQLLQLMSQTTQDQLEPANQEEWANDSSDTDDPVLRTIKSEVMVCKENV